MISRQVEGADHLHRMVEESASATLTQVIREVAGGSRSNEALRTVARALALPLSILQELRRKGTTSEQDDLRSA